MNRALEAGRAFWTCAVVTLISALVSAGYSLAGLVGMSSSNVFAWYAASRSVALPLAVLATIVFRSRHGILALALVMSFIQAFDAGIGFHLGDPAKAYGPLAFAAINFATLIWLLRFPSPLREL